MASRLHRPCTNGSIPHLKLLCYSAFHLYRNGSESVFSPPSVFGFQEAEGGVCNVQSHTIRRPHEIYLALVYRAACPLFRFPFTGCHWNVETWSAFMLTLVT